MKKIGVPIFTDPMVTVLPKSHVNLKRLFSIPFVAMGPEKSKTDTSRPEATLPSQVGTLEHGTERLDRLKKNRLYER